MRVFLRYALRETGTNLWRNRLMTIAAVLTVAVSLSLVGSALLLKQSAAQASAQWEKGTRVTVWMNPDATSSQIGDVGNQLHGSPYVHDCNNFDKQASYLQAKHIIDPSIFAVMTPDKMPTSYQCVPTVPQNAFVIEQAYTGQPGVFQVTAPEQQIRQMQKTIHVLQVVFLALAGVLLLSATVLILNTIRMAIFARRREVSVMKLVGATNWFIRIPFITEGFVQGLLGSVVAVGATTAVQTWYPLSSEYQISLANLWGTNVVVIVLGISIGSIGSALAIRRFLDV